MHMPQYITSFALLVASLSPAPLATSLEPSSITMSAIENDASVEILIMSGASYLFTVNMCLASLTRQIHAQPLQ